MCFVMQSTSTSGLLASFKDLANAKPYVFSVQSYSGQHRSGGTGQVSITLHVLHRCKLVLYA